MNAPKRWLCLVLSLALSASLILPAGAADPLATTFSTFLIDAETSDSPVLDLHVALYRRDSAGAFTVDDSVRYSCNINRAAGKTSFYIQPQADRVWVEAETLTREDCQDLLSAAGATEGMLVLLTGRLEPGAGDQAVLSD